MPTPTAASQAIKYDASITLEIMLNRTERAKNPNCFEPAFTNCVARPLHEPGPRALSSAAEHRASMRSFPIQSWC